MSFTQELLSDIVVYNKYAKYVPELNRRETWNEIVDRYLNMMTERYPELSYEIKKYGEFLHEKKVLMSMRAAQFAGKPILKNNARIYNCCYLPINHYKAFSEIMFLLLSGTGVGFSVQGAHIAKLPKIKKPTQTMKYLVSDDIEGWANAVNILFKAYFGLNDALPIFDFSDIRAKGERLITSGGKAPGPDPLRECLIKLNEILSQKENGEQLSDIEVHDLVCHIANSVLAGGIRRSALISLFDKDSEAMLTCKHGEWWVKNPQRGRANNSAMLNRATTTKEEFDNIFTACKNSFAGEPGMFFTDDDKMKYGTNPCAEISLREFSFCNLTEINAGNIKSKKDFQQRVRAAAFFGTLQAGFVDFHYLRSIWKKNTMNDSLIGIGITGICNGDLIELDKKHKNILKSSARLAKRVNKYYASKIGIRSAARVTTIKPSGCRPGTPDSLVTTEEGIYTLNELFKDHRSATGFNNINGKYTAVENGNRLSKTFANGTETVFEIELQGQIKLKSTKNHPWFVTSSYKNKKYTSVNKFVNTIDIEEGDILDIKMGVYKGSVKQLKSINLFSYKMSNINIDVSFPTEMNNDLAWLIGYIHGDGSICPVKYRFRFIDEYEDNLLKARSVFETLFNITGNIRKLSDRNAYSLEIASKVIFDWFVENDIKKNTSVALDTIPLVVRESTAEHILAYFAGLIDSDGCVRILDTYKGFTISQALGEITSHWQHVGLAVGVHMNHSLNVQRNGYSDTTMVLLSSTGFTTPEAASIINANSVKLSKIDLPMQSSETCAPNQILGKVKGVTILGEMETYDVEVENEHWFYAGAVKSHNTTSCVLSCSSGIHAWHSEKYIRNMQCAVGDDLYNYFMTNHPELIKVMDYDPKSAVIGIPQISPSNAIIRNAETALDFVERVKKFNVEWVQVGHRRGPNFNNVSATISVKDNEWDTLQQWMWDNRTSYNGLSILPYDGGTYADAPFQEVSDEVFNRKLEYILNNDIDLTMIEELVDNTTLSAEVACAGGQCEINI